VGIGRRRRTARTILVAAAAIALVSAAAGCTGERTEPDDIPLSPAELGWIRAYSAWTIALYNHELGPPPGRPLVTACAARLEGVGDPPTDRLRPAWERAAAACPLLAQRGSVRRAEDIVDAADDLVEPYFLDEKDLPLAGAPTRASRADVRLSAIASGAADDDQEVRCWSTDDWRRLIDEENAWTVESDDPDDLYGFQDEETDRIHMRLAQCNVLHRLGREDILTWTRADQVMAADSTATLVHEIEHLLLPDAEEDEVECAAAKKLERFGRRLGATPDETKRLAGLYATDVRKELPDDYLSSCDGAFA
jgi:hypothetical protein